MPGALDRMFLFQIQSRDNMTIQKGMFGDDYTPERGEDVKFQVRKIIDDRPAEVQKVLFSTAGDPGQEMLPGMEDA